MSCLLQDQFLFHYSGDLRRPETDTCKTNGYDSSVSGVAHVIELGLRILKIGPLTLCLKTVFMVQ
jgi:hypothetical protein